MNKKKALIFFLTSMAACGMLAFFLPFSEEVVSSYQKQQVDATMLNHGETGKILKDLNLILPTEKQNKEAGPKSNVLEVIERAAKDRNKWIWLDQYKKYQSQGVFCYFEIESPGPEFSLSFLTRKSGKWVIEFAFPITSDRKIYVVFLDHSGSEIPLQFILANRTAPFTIHSMAFLQNGYHPIIYSDRPSFFHLLSHVTKNDYSLSSTALTILPSEKDRILPANLHFQESWKTGVSKFEKKRGNTHIAMTPRSKHPLIANKKTEPLNLANLSKEGLPIISIEVQDADLYSDDYGILTNFDEHGRDWERLSHVQYFKEGKRVIDCFTGLRLQGGDPGRKKGLINFRLFFREEYGKARIEGSKIFTRKTSDIKRLAIKQAEWEQWPLNSPLAYDISHEIGALAPPTESVILYLNGKSLGLYYVVPHLGEKQIEEMLPEGNYQYYRFRGALHDADKEFFQTEFWERLYNREEKLTERYAEQFFDLENLTNQLFSYLYNGTGDFCQGVAVKGTAPQSKMFWLSWDMDWSFVDKNVDISKTDLIQRERWEQPPDLGLLFTKEDENKPHYCPRVRLFRKLVNSDPVFREKVKESFMEIMNHRLPDETINQLLYEAWADLSKASHPHRDAFIGNVSDFLRHRKHFLIKQMEDIFLTPSAQPCNVDAGAFPFKVDGYTKRKRYEGYYFPGSVIKITADSNAPFKYWLVDGAVHSDSELELVVPTDRRCQIKAVYQ